MKGEISVATFYSNVCPITQFREIERHPTAIALDQLLLLSMQNERACCMWSGCGLASGCES